MGGHGSGFANIFPFDSQIFSVWVFLSFHIPYGDLHSLLRLPNSPPSSKYGWIFTHLEQSSVVVNV